MKASFTGLSLIELDSVDGPPVAQRFVGGRFRTNLFLGGRNPALGLTGVAVADGKEGAGVRHRRVVIAEPRIHRLRQLNVRLVHMGGVASPVGEDPHVVDKVLIVRVSRDGGCKHARDGGVPDVAHDLEGARQGIELACARGQTSAWVLPGGVSGRGSSVASYRA